MKKKLAKKKISKKVTLKRSLIYFLLIVLSFASLILLPNKIALNNECANSISCIKNLSGNYEDDNIGEFSGKKFTGPALAAKPYVKEKLAVNNVLGDTSSDSKRITIDLSTQTLYAFENGNKVFEFKVSTGKWWPTPTGDFRIWIKLRYTRMSGGSKANGTYYNLPNVPYTMYFYNDKVPKYRGYGIHGAYWHDNFGHPMSHGCVNMREEDVAQLYVWANPTSNKYVTYASESNPGTLVTIYGITPKE